MKESSGKNSGFQNKANDLKEYSAPFFLFNAHLETIFPALFRRVSVSYRRERIVTPDDDFLDLDWLKQGSKKLVIIQHGMEGNSMRAYIKGMAKAFFDNGFDSLAWNYRGCSGEMNTSLRFYHSGATDDLRHVIDFAAQESYEEIFLIGFSLGGNLTLKYLGEPPVNPKVKKAVVFSVPLHLESSSRQLSIPANRIYAWRFLSSLKKKVIQKSKLRSGLDLTRLRNIRSIFDFDDAYTAPLHGFLNALDYYNQCSAINFLPVIGIPALIINTRNDPFLTEECFPSELLKEHPYVKLEIHNKGGHVGFTRFDKNGVYWSEQRALDWILHGC